MYVYWTHARIQVQHTTLHEASKSAKWRCERHAACLEDATDATEPLWPTLPVTGAAICYLLPPAECVSLHLVTRPVNPLRSIRTCVTPRSRGSQWEASDDSGWPIRGHELTHSAAPALGCKKSPAPVSSCLVFREQEEDCGGRCHVL